ncbi:hypothetical protein F443_10966 [Phytophthora nicotianae P1569]|uniref:Uncharacterized protein n=1 Tax=Phytophthora nicotianae P1569 TaxID=1317065 RepID=V9EZQ9_PHYNI|nr:hypothetical protein F443_10966 [Phytophthora nicotianae P1569]
MSHRSDESQAQEPRAPRRGIDLLFDELEEGQIDLGEPMAGDTSSQDASTRFHHSMVPSPAASVRFHGSAPRSPPMRVLRAPNPFPERSNPLRSLRDAPPLPSRYDEEDQRDLNVIRNDLDEAQSRMLSTQQSSRPVARPLVHSSRRDYGFQPRDAAETARRATQQPLDTYMSGPAAATADEQEYRERLQLQLNRRSVPSMQPIPVVLNPGESQSAYEAQFQNWVELARRLPSYNALRASFSETDICLERRLRLVFAKSKARRQLLGPRPHRHEVSTPPAPDVPDHKLPRRQGNLAGGEPQTPTSYVSEGNPPLHKILGMTLAKTSRQ